FARSVPRDSPQGEAVWTARASPNHSNAPSPAGGPRVAIAEILSRIAAELALFAGVGFLLFAVNDLAVDLIYFGRSVWRSLTVYTRYPRAFASYFVFNKSPGFIAVLVPAWDESTVIASMLRAALDRLDYDRSEERRVG